jgi:3-hydroxyisobutyrate dehydrogenase
MLDHVTPIPNVQTEHWVPSNSGYKPGFRTEMMVKDLGLGVELAGSLGTRAAMGERAVEEWAKAGRDERCRGRDGSSIYLYVGGELPEGCEDRGRRGEDGEWVFEE